jgi:hypothetical protein
MRVYLGVFCALDWLVHVCPSVSLPVSLLRYSHCYNSGLRAHSCTRTSVHIFSTIALDHIVATVSLVTTVGLDTAVAFVIRSVALLTSSPLSSSSLFNDAFSASQTI